MGKGDQVCPSCQGSGWIFEREGQKEIARPCSCQQDDTLQAKYFQANIPPRFCRLELKAYLPSKENPSQAKAKNIAEKFARDYPAVEGGLIFIGPTGVGKTRLLCNIGTHLIREKNVETYYIDWNDLVREMRSGEDYSSRDFSTIGTLIQKLTAVELLLFDEMGASKPSQWVEDNIYFLINRRYNDNKVTVFASNYFDKNAKGEETLTDRIGERIRSRIREMATLVEILGGDFRRTL